jgi:hypothetical protein
VIAGSNPVAPTIEAPGCTRESGASGGFVLRPRALWQQRSSNWTQKPPSGAVLRHDLRHDEHRPRRLEREPVNALAHVVEVEVAVDLGRDGRVRVAQDLLHRRERDARLEQQGGRRVPKVVEPELARDRLRAKPPAAVGWNVSRLRGASQGFGPVHDADRAPTPPCPRSFLGPPGSGATAPTGGNSHGRRGIRA